MEYISNPSTSLIQMSGAIGVPIHYNSTDEDLYAILQRINGVHFTGGGLDLINPKTGEQHPYYVTAKKIVEYSKKLYDE